MVKIVHGKRNLKNARNYTNVYISAPWLENKGLKSWKYNYSQQCNNGPQYSIRVITPTKVTKTYNSQHYNSSPQTL